MSRKCVLKEDDVDPLNGPKGDTAFLQSNYKLMAVGGVFHTPKARFTQTQIRTGANKAGFAVKIKEEGPWLRVQVTGKAQRPAQTERGPAVYTGAGKVY
jgi:hypothetical protein